MSVDPDRLWSHVERLASEPRPAQTRILESCRAYVTDHLESAGCRVERCRFVVGDGRERLEGVNLVACWPERFDPGGPRLVVGAHLDSCPETPGADDNASAVAALLEIAHCLGQDWPLDAGVSLELVAFDLEEDGMLGGAEHAGQLRDLGVDLLGMVSLEMLGYRDPSPGAQSLPRALRGLYPDTGDFIAVVGNTGSQALIDGFAAGLQTIEGLPVETLAVPGNGEQLQATRLSDHSPFWDAGFPAVMVTDTSFMRNPHYHLPSDTPETLDREFLEDVTRGCLAAVCRIMTGAASGDLAGE
ncbi:MAG: M28 family peptidase [Planctomycetaceae bacterium]|jgi:hypothetical protein|nr:M28 family peptidase [Planctomycetaceae bacterium]